MVSRKIYKLTIWCKLVALVIFCGWLFFWPEKEIAESSLYSVSEEAPLQVEQKYLKCCSREEWNSLSEKERDIVMNFRMKRDTRTFAEIEKGSSEHRKIIENEDQMHWRAIEREMTPSYWDSVLGSYRPNYKKEYTREEFQALSREERQYISGMRSCEPNNKLIPMDFDCSIFLNEYK